MEERQVLGILAEILLGTIDSVKHTEDAVGLAAEIMIDVDSYLLRRKVATGIDVGRPARKGGTRMEDKVKLWGDPNGNIHRMNGDQEIIATVTKACTEEEWLQLCNSGDDNRPARKE
jgi:hypothetical protein